MNDAGTSPYGTRNKLNAWKVLIFLTITNALMSLDRTLPQLVAEPVKHEFGLTDAQLGLFIGVAFGLSYGAAGLLVGPLVDRYNRKNLLAVILSVWSGMTFLTGLAGSYLWLLLTRTGLGAAEAGGNPTALSIIGDIFPPEKRSSAIGIYKIGVPAGIFLASVIVGVVAADFGWRMAFFVAGIPGLLLALVIFIGVREPSRGAFEAPRDGGYRPVPYRDAVGFILRDPCVMPLTVGLFVTAFAGASIYAFQASFLQRFHGMSLEEVGFYVAVGSGISAISPVIIGFVADRVTKNGSKALLYFLAVINALVGISAMVLLSPEDTTLAISGLLVWQFFNMALTTPGMAAVIIMTPAGMRGTIIAFISVGNMLIGFGFGPYVVGLISDSMDVTNPLQSALIIVASVGYVLSTLSLWFSGRRAGGIGRRETI